MIIQRQQRLHIPICQNSLLALNKKIKIIKNAHKKKFLIIIALPYFPQMNFNALELEVQKEIFPIYLAETSRFVYVGQVCHI